MISTGAAIVGGTIASGLLGSRAQRKAAEQQAKGIENAQAISAEAAAQARNDALSLFAPAFGDISRGIQQARNDLLAGQRSVQNILNASTRNASNLIQTSNQQAINAILGNPMVPQQQKQQLIDQTMKPGFVGPAPIDPRGQPQPMADNIKPQARNLAPPGQDFGLRGGVAQQQAQQQLPTDPSRPLQGQLAPANIDFVRPGQASAQGEYGLTGAESAIRQALGAQVGALTQGTEAGLGALRRGVSTGRGDIRRGLEAGIGYIDPYMQTGESALQREAALSGALGQEAQQAAYDSFIESPGQSYLREQAERALTRNQAAVGGLGGGNVLRELQRQAIGMSAQNLQQEIDNLRSLSGRGQQAATAGAGLQQQAGQSLANLAMQGGMSELQARALLGSQLAGAYGQAGGVMSGLRFGAGQDIANLLSGGGQQQAQLASGLGSNLANIQGQTASNIANLAVQQGGATSDLRTNLAGLLANLATGQGTQQANLAGSLGGARAAGVTNPFGNIISTLTGIAASNPGALGIGGGTDPNWSPFD